MIPFNKPFISGNELAFIEDAMQVGMSGGGKYTHKCLSYFKENYDYENAYLTHSCTAALEMCALLLNLQEGDEIIMPSYTFTSTANAFLLRGANIKFVDSHIDSPNLCLDSVKANITAKTKAIVVVHYAGISCDMNALMRLASEHDIYVIEDAAQALGALYDGKHLGTFGHLSTISFHDTKNVHCGEGGLLVINDEKFIHHASVMLNYGTNREEFIQKKVPSYEWCGVGSSFMCADLNAAFLWGQLQSTKDILIERKRMWAYYQNQLEKLNLDCRLPKLSELSDHNGHLFYLTCENKTQRDQFIKHMKAHNVQAVFHYQSLCNSIFFKSKYDGPELKNASHYSDCLVRLPLYIGLKVEEQDHVINAVQSFFLS